MSSSRANKPDTQADIELRQCLTGTQKRNFIMVAGAGSGKTTSLVKALATTIEAYGSTLKVSRQRVACITYTEIAAGEIWADVGNNPLIHVSTIHSFLWSITRSFQYDIKAWVLRRISERIDDLTATAAGFGPRVQQRTRDKNQRDIARFEESRGDVELVRAFTYGTGSDYAKGILGHDDIIRMATDFILERPLFRTLIAQQFPFVFVDESQDTQEVVVEALKAAAAQAGGKFCLGFFGDPMQRIYPTGIGPIELEDGWLLINKEENFRCPRTVLAVANAIRRDGDDLVQAGGRMQEIGGVRELVDGTARIFVLPADGRRNERLSAVRGMVARENADIAWVDGHDADYKLLVIVHRMAATRLGFGALYAAMNDKAPGSFRDGFLDATAWPIRPFTSFILPVVEAIEAGDEFAVMSLLRKHCPRLKKDSVSKMGAAELLAALRGGVFHLSEMLAVDSAATVRDVLSHVRDLSLVTLDPRIIAYLDDHGPILEANAAEVDEEEDTTREIAAMDAFLGCSALQFRGYRRYIQQLSPFSTQQGIKGAEFERVLVVLDDEEGTHVQFSYDKYFGVKALSARDDENIRGGKETSVERTRRLFYVCCTRALTDLVVVYFSNDPAVAIRNVRASGIFPDDAVFDEAALG
ncbi:DNA helicase-2 / ATP-dependent DNA helicase PcrA [Pseudorhodobacter antarcticus]|uniref:DNA helicase-2 / ATP-dependent DNA helicase PcrA n=1 Tax=Pseudorhodobacter antarcticus TaxID=1077947 RepID=A0A1H8KKG7_9RHOB|nr:UvrD-helicase domain-containing protein [Pseudorhodobacter antarcticus]SEN92898.1 DNA helicase-2 / ATP-dependent DNA helicase PcrA [Pseudorhodobacter antarcticus]